MAANCWAGLAGLRHRRRSRNRPPSSGRGTAPNCRGTDRLAGRFHALPGGGRRARRRFQSRFRPPRARPRSSPPAAPPTPSGSKSQPPARRNGCRRGCRSAARSPLLWERARIGPLSLWERVRVRAERRNRASRRGPHPRPLSQRERGGRRKLRGKTDKARRHHAQGGLLAVSDDQQIAGVLPQEHRGRGILDGHGRAEPRLAPPARWRATMGPPAVPSASGCRWGRPGRCLQRRSAAATVQCLCWASARTCRKYSSRSPSGSQTTWNGWLPS